MEGKFELLPCVGLSDRCPAVKRADKFAKEIDESANSLQQLKAEISLGVGSIARDSSILAVDRLDRIVMFVNEKLSAV